MTIEKIDDKNFNKVDSVSTAYNVDDIAAQIDIINKRIAQIISNYQDKTNEAIQPSLDERATLQQLLDDAAAAGVVPDTPPDQSLDVSTILDTVTSLKNDAGSIAAPPVVDVPVDTPPIDTPVT